MATENKQVSTWLPPELAERLRQQAEDEERTVSQILKRALQEYLTARDSAAAA